jgi:signal recognition particle subunit SRP54
MRLMPGMNKEMREAAGQIDDGEVAKVEAIVCSMTPAERNDTSMMDGSRRSRVARGSGTTVQDVNSLLKQFKEMQKMMKGMASGNMPNLPGMPNMSGMSGRAAKKLAQQAAGFGGAGQAAGASAAGGADFDMLSQLMGADASDADLAELAQGFPGLPSGAPSGGAPRPVVRVNKGTKKKKKGGRVTPPKNR